MLAIVNVHRKTSCNKDLRFKAVRANFDENLCMWVWLHKKKTYVYASGYMRWTVFCWNSALGSSFFEKYSMLEWKGVKMTVCWHCAFTSRCKWVSFQQRSLILIYYQFASEKTITTSLLCNISLTIISLASSVLVVYSLTINVWKQNFLWLRDISIEVHWFSVIKKSIDVRICNYFRSSD